MLDEQQQIADPLRTSLFDERPLQRKRLWIAHHAETPDFDGAVRRCSLQYVPSFGGQAHLTHSTHLTC
jgi:hypothetical protein